MSGNPAPRETTTLPTAVASGADLGLYAADDFRITTGRCTDCPAIRQALWYFERETIAVAKEGRPVARFVRGLRFDEDLAAWLGARDELAQLEFPPLVWIAAPHLATGARLTGDLDGLVTGFGPLSFRLAPKIPLNRSYFDDSSARFFVGREIKVRGTVTSGAIVARTLWPEDFRLSVAPPARPAPLHAPPAIALRARMRAEKNGGAMSPYAIETLWQRPGSNADLRGRAVLAFMINGAQGDDDEAHAGHFALVTGRVQSDGAIGDWLVNSFYTLDTESEKGILAAPVPLDDYLADLNAGQNWYRPSYMLVAVLSAGRAAALVQSALGRVYNQFYRHQIVYYHPTTNCTSLSIDTLRALGWDVPARGQTSRLLAWAGFPLLALKERSIAKARVAFDYLCADQTRLLPAAAAEEIFGSLLDLGTGDAMKAPAGGPLAQMLARDLDALVFVRFPQFPSSRAWGDAPAATVPEYKERLPRDPAMAKVVPVPPRQLPRCAARPGPAPSAAPAVRHRVGGVGDFADRRHPVGIRAIVAAMARAAGHPGDSTPVQRFADRTAAR